MIICVTNRLACRGGFLERIEEIAKAGPHAIILREKDLSHDAYESLAAQCKQIADRYNTPLIIHSNIEAGRKLSIDKIHLSLPLLLKNLNEMKKFSVIGASIHSVEQAVQAAELGATYLIAGHIFETCCKKGIEPRGLDFLEQVCKSVSIPVFGIGGITKSNIALVLNAGAAGGCVMSGFMTCGSAYNELTEYKLKSG